MPTNDGHRAGRPTVAQRYPTAILVAGAVLGIVAVALALRLKLRTSFAELLPSGDPAVQALKRTEGRVGDLNLLTVGIRSPDRAANLAYAKILTEAQRTLPKSRVGLVAYNMLDLRKFFHDHRWLYASEADLEAARDRLRSEIMRRKNPLFVSLDDENESDDDTDLRSKLEHNPLAQRFPDGYFVNGDVAWVLVLPTGGLFDENAGEALVGAVKDFVAAHPPRDLHPAMRVDTLGPVVVGLENRHAIEQDIKGVTIFCTIVIALLLIIILLPRSRRHRAGGLSGDVGHRGRVRVWGRGLRVPQLVDGVPGHHHPRERDQPRDNLAFALSGVPRARSR